MKKIKLGLCLAGSLLILVGSVTPAVADAIYWTETGTGRVQTADLDGSNVTSLATGGVPLGIALDIAGGKVYWVDNNAIRRANLDGTGAEAVLTGLGYSYGLALDVANGKMYWTEYGPGIVRRANLDGSDVENLVAPGGQLWGIKLDLDNRKMYWVEGNGTIRRANMDGSDVTVLLGSAYSPLDIALDLAAGRIYWTESHTGASVYRIRYANLSDGSGQTDLVSSGVISPHLMDIDLINKRLYWTTYGSSSIQRVDLDGSNLQTIVTGLNVARGIAVHSIPEPVSLLLVGVGAAVLLRRLRRQ